MRKWLRVMLVAFFWLVSGCLFQDTAQDRPLRVGWYRWPGWYPMAIAQDQELFVHAGANILPVLYDNYARMMVDLVSGRLDGCCGGMYEFLRSGVPDLKIVLATDYSDGAEGLVAAADIRTPRDLVGKRVGLQQGGSGSEFLIAAMLVRHGLSILDLRVVDLDPELVAEEMPHNIQAGYTWEPHLSAAQAKGGHVLFSTADIPGMIVDVVAFSDRAAQDRAAAVRAFVAVWFEAQTLWVADPRKAAASIARITGDTPPTEISGCRILDLDANQRAFQDGDSCSSLYHVGTKQIEFLVEQGYLSQRPDLRRILDGSFLPTRRAGS